MAVPSFQLSEQTTVFMYDSDQVISLSNLTANGNPVFLRTRFESSFSQSYPNCQTMFIDGIVHLAQMHPTWSRLRWEGSKGARRVQFLKSNISFYGEKWPQSNPECSTSSLLQLISGSDDRFCILMQGEIVGNTRGTVCKRDYEGTLMDIEGHVHEDPSNVKPPAMSFEIKSSRGNIQSEKGSDDRFCILMQGEIVGNTRGTVCKRDYEGTLMDIEGHVHEDPSNVKPPAMSFEIKSSSIIDWKRNYTICDGEVKGEIQKHNGQSDPIWIKIRFDVSTSRSFDDTKPIFIQAFLKGKKGEKQYQFLRTEFHPSQDHNLSTCNELPLEPSTIIPVTQPDKCMPPTFFMGVILYCTLILCRSGLRCCRPQMMPSPPVIHKCAESPDRVVPSMPAGVPRLPTSDPTSPLTQALGNERPGALELLSHSYFLPSLHFLEASSYSTCASSFTAGERGSATKLQTQERIMMTPEKNSPIILKAQGVVRRYTVGVN
ncbi:unnamed protein product [Darwinula stevensoni]|uniref:Uncharacterized protein n=1 Tax=Darwinula stevensoni TaxID=69355 RepID=A0A7R8XEN0_9CRUS|nr:unnamed protein product [Darwinula stevensoni]CAG0895964.1 unnamed protein product [Darwinula stevensoni]